MWWTLVRAKLERARVALPRDLRGTIQVERRGAAAEYRFLRVDGPNTRAYEGVAANPDAWVEVSDDDLARFTQDGTIPSGALRTLGDAGLVRRFLASLDADAKKRSWLDLKTIESAGR